MNMRTLQRHLLFALLLTLGSTSCVFVPNQRGEAVYHSDEYVVYQMQKGDTSASLAKRFLGDSNLLWRIEEANRSIQPNDYIVIPLKPRNKGGIFETGIQQIPILCYHRFGKHCDSPLCIPDRTFEMQMRYLKENGYYTLTPEKLLDFLEYRQPVPRKSVVITVDDGYRSFYDVAYPVLKKYRFTATLFVYVNFIGVSSKSLNWAQLRELKDNGISIGSHTVMHSDLSKQADHEDEDAYMQRLHREIFDSKRIIDAKLDQDTFVFAYPFGRVNHTAGLMAHQAGYRLAMTVRRGGNPFFADPYSLQRDQILERDLDVFITRLKVFQSLSLR